MARHMRARVPYSRLKEEIVDVLKKEDYIKNFSITEENNKKAIDIELLYKNGEPAVTDLNRISKPGLRQYVDRKEIPVVLSGLGTAILTTSKGVMTGRQARQQGIGGEIICNIW